MLNNRAIEAAKPRAAVYRMTDANGLFLEVRPTGKKVWRYRYEIAARENTFTIGEYGDAADQVGLAAARAARAEAAALVANNEHPRAFKRSQILARVEANKNTFATLAADYLANKGHVSPHYFKQIKTALDVDLLPTLGEFPPAKITAAHILPILQARADVPSWAKLVRRVASEVFTFGILSQRAESDPTYALRNVISSTGLIKSKRAKPNAYLLANEIPEFLEAVDAAPATQWDAERKIGIRLLMLTLVRPNELAGAAWAEFDLDGAIWAIPAARMKMRGAHLVPLSRQAVALLRELHALTGDTPVLFPEREARKRTGENVTRWPQMFARFIRGIGFAGRLTAHGMRATASTYLNGVRVQVGAVKVKRFENDWIEAQLAHVPRGIRAHYNHASYLPERAEMMQFYADVVMPSNVIPFRIAA